MNADDLPPVRLTMEDRALLAEFANKNPGPVADAIDRVMAEIGILVKLLSEGVRFVEAFDEKCKRLEEQNAVLRDYVEKVVAELKKMALAL